MPARVLVAGGGVAAMEAVAALRALAGERVELTVVAPTQELHQRAMSVAVTFALSAPAPVLLSKLSGRVPFELRRGALERVDPERRIAHLRGGERVGYDALVVATGAVPRPAFPGAITFADARDAPALMGALDAGGQVVFVAATASSWPMPTYELALLSAQARPGVSVAVVTAEPAPLWIFGAEAGEAIRELFRARSIGLLSGVRVLSAGNGELELSGAEPITADHAVAHAQLVGPEIPGLPHDDQGFIPVDAHGAVVDTPGVYAAGDVTAFPLKQGGLAAQQADAVAASIAAAVGAPVAAEPFEPILRGLLLTGHASLYLRTDGSQGTAHRVARAAVSGGALWWPPAKVAARHLSALLGTGGDGPPLEDLRAPPDPENAAQLALMLAREDADRGDYAGALRALDTAKALAGGDLTPEWDRTRTLWEARAGWGST